MSTYVMSDLHGCFDEFQKMLKKLNFSDEDQLIIAGDYIDRGKQSLEMMEWIKNPPENVVLIKGNHDEEFIYYIDILEEIEKNLDKDYWGLNSKMDSERDSELEDLESEEASESEENSDKDSESEEDMKTEDSVEDEVLDSDKDSDEDSHIDLADRPNEYLRGIYDACLYLANSSGEYFDHYGTLEQLIFEKNVTFKQLKEWADSMRNLPYYYETTVNDRDVIVVHAGYTTKEQLSNMGFAATPIEKYYVYAREEAYRSGGKANAVIVAGHTPTIVREYPTFANGKIFKYHRVYDNCMFFDIDCGAVFRERFNISNMAALRLEDFEEFYLWEN